jgi:tetratricopeptide (TPR) repeat protein
VRRNWCRACAGLAILAVTLAPGFSSAQLDRADPLTVPRSSLPRPGDAPELAPEARLITAAAVLQEHGYEELPYVAWALLKVAGERGDAELARRALALAPATPGAYFEAAKVAREPHWLFGSFGAFWHSFPAMLWGLTIAGAVVGLGIIGTASVLLALAFARGAPLHAYVLGRRMESDPPPIWPGVLLLLTLVGLSTLIGLGWLGVLGLAGALAAARLRPRESLGVAGVLALLGLVIGPGLELWARAATSLDHDAALAVAWRVERGHSLPGDEALVDSALARRPADAVVRLAAITARSRAGDVDGALALLPASDGIKQPHLRVAFLNLDAALRLAQGDVRRAIENLEAARRVRSTARVLFNLSQAYGRSLRLMDNKAAFNTAREMDPELVGSFTQGDGLHTFLMPVRLPAFVYLMRSLVHTPESAAYTRALRKRLLGTIFPDFAWMALPLLGIAAAFLRRSNIVRCARCDRFMRRTDLPARDRSTTCMRCERLFEHKDKIDARVRQRARSIRLASVGGLVPGLILLHDGLMLRGVTQVALAAVGIALLCVGRLVSAPWEVGTLAGGLSMALGIALVVPVWLAALLQAARLLKGRRSAT